MARLSETEHAVLCYVDYKDGRADLRSEYQSTFDDLVSRGFIERRVVYDLTEAGRLALQYRGTGW